MATFKDGKRIDGGPSDRHYEILASHGHTEGVPAKFLPQAPQSTGGGYTSFKDMFDGGGPGASGAMFSSKPLTGYDKTTSGYISQAAINKVQANNPDKFKADFGTGIGGLSNNLGFRPYGSYGSEAGLPAGQGINIGTSGLANIMTGAANPFLQMLGFSNKNMVNPNLPLGAILNPAPAPKPVSAPINPGVGVPMSGSAVGVTTPLAQNPEPIQAIMNGGLIGLRRYMYGGMV